MHGMRACYEACRFVDVGPAVRPLLPNDLPRSSQNIDFASQPYRLVVKKGALDVRFRKARSGVYLDWHSTVDTSQSRSLYISDPGECVEEERRFV